MRLQHRFSDSGLLEQALTHRSAGRRNNERLEFLGDALLNAIVAEYIFEQFPRASEGDMTRLRASLVSGVTLAELAREQELGASIVLGPGELKTGGHRRESILADTFEALIAAIFLDAGWETCRREVRALFETRIRSADTRVGKDPKTSLQELMQAHGQGLPAYTLLATSGDDHAKTFEVRCDLGDLGLSAQASGNSRRGAEQAAAEQLLEPARDWLANRRKAGKA